MGLITACGKVVLAAGLLSSPISVPPVVGMGLDLINKPKESIDVVLTQDMNAGEQCMYTQAASLGENASLTVCLEGNPAASYRAGDEVTVPRELVLPDFRHEFLEHEKNMAYSLYTPATYVTRHAP